MPEQPSGLERALPLIALAIGGLKGGAPGGQLLQSFAGAQQQRQQLELEQATQQRAERGLALQEQQFQATQERQQLETALALKKLRLDVMLKALSAEDPETAQLILDSANQELGSGGIGLQMSLPAEVVDARNRARLQKLAKDELDRQLKVFSDENQLIEMAQTGATQVVSSALLRALPKDLRVGANSIKVRDLMVIAGWPIDDQGELISPQQSGEVRFRADFAQRLGKTVGELNGKEEAAAKKAWEEQTRLPPQPPAFEPLVPVDTVGADGKPVRLFLPRSQAAGQSFEKPPPTATIEREEARKRLIPAIESLERISTRVIARVGPAQRVEAIKRGAEAVFGTDPEFLTYQDARMSLAGNLAVAQQGSRPSDADIRAVWLPLVPDAFRDTAASAEMKWGLIREMMSLPARDTPLRSPEPDATGSPLDRLRGIRGR